MDGHRFVVDGLRFIVDGHRFVVDGSRFIVDGHRSVVDGSRFVVDGHRSVVDGSRFVVDGHRSVADGSRFIVDGHRSVADGSRFVVDGHRSVVDGLRFIVDGYRFIVDGHELVAVVSRTKAPKPRSFSSGRGIHATGESSAAARYDWIADGEARATGHPMDEADFEGTLVLEKLAQIGRVEDFFDAVDSDDAGRAASLMKKAGIAASTIAIVLRKMEEADGEH